MKEITRNTKIGDLIPDGFEIDESGDLNPYANNKQTLMIPLIKSEIKNFDWYTSHYFSQDIRWNISAGDEYVRDLMQKCEYNKIPFEIKIGLLKFIANSLYPKTHWLDVVNNISLLLRNFSITQDVHELYRIFPKDLFLNILEIK